MTRLARPVAGVVVLAGTATATVVGGPWRSQVVPPASPRTSFVQDSAGVHVFVHNPNRHWGLRHQRVVITLHDSGAGFDVIRTYGPDRRYSAHRQPGEPEIRCCEIALLAPRGDYRFDLWPTRRRVAYVTIDPRGDGWFRA